MILTKLNRSVKSFGLLFAGILVMVQLTGCTSSVKVLQKSPAKAPEAAKLRNVALIGFEGKKRRDVNVAFETMLVEHRFNDEPYFTVVDLARNKTLIRELKRSLSGNVTPSTAVKFGKRIGVRGIYFGNTKDLTLSSRRSKGKQSYCKRYSSNGSKCKESGWRKVSCTERTVNITIVPRLVNVETGQVIYRAEHTGVSSSSACAGNRLKPDDVLIKEAIAISIDKIRADVAPNGNFTRVILMDEPSNLNSAETQEFLKGLEFANSQRMDRACRIWRDLDRQVRSSDNALVYNVAVCKELEGNYQAALRLIELIDGRLNHPDNNVNKALDRLKTNLEVQ